MDMSLACSEQASSYEPIAVYKLEDGDIAEPLLSREWCQRRCCLPGFCSVSFPLLISFVTSIVCGSTWRSCTSFPAESEGAWLLLSPAEQHLSVGNGRDIEPLSSAFVLRR